MPIISDTAQSANSLIAQTKQSLVVREIKFNKGDHDAPHRHPWHQLIMPRKGVLRTRTAYKEYYVPFNRAVLIPAECRHESWALTTVQFIGVYIDPHRLNWNAEYCKTVEVSQLFRELVMHIVETYQLTAKPCDKQQTTTQFFLNQTMQQNEVDFELVLPRDKRARKVADDLLTNPALNTKLSDWGTVVGASDRTIARLFEKETGQTFARWRQRLRLYHSLSMIEQKLPIHTVALNIGYQSSSAFIHSFKKEFGMTPQRYR